MDALYPVQLGGTEARKYIDHPRSYSKVRDEGHPLFYSPFMQRQYNFCSYSDMASQINCVNPTINGGLSDSFVESIEQCVNHDIRFRNQALHRILIRSVQL